MEAVAREDIARERNVVEGLMASTETWRVFFFWGRWIVLSERKMMFKMCL